MHGIHKANMHKHKAQYNTWIHISINTKYTHKAHMDRWMDEQMKRQRNRWIYKRERKRKKERTREREKERDRKIER